MSKLVNAFFSYIFFITFSTEREPPIKSFRESRAPNKREKEEEEGEETDKTKRGERSRVFVSFVRRGRTTIDEIGVHGFSTIRLNEFLGREERKEGRKRREEGKRESLPREKKR